MVELANCFCATDPPSVPTKYSFVPLDDTITGLVICYHQSPVWVLPYCGERDQRWTQKPDKPESVWTFFPLSRGEGIENIVVHHLPNKAQLRGFRDRYYRRQQEKRSLVRSTSLTCVQHPSSIGHPSTPFPASTTIRLSLIMAPSPI